jgi:hypothetical protein
MDRSGMVPTYHMAPNFSIGPPGVELELGLVYEEITDIGSENPLNKDDYLSIPQHELYCDHKGGFTAKRSDLKSGEYGVWAKYVGMNGIGGELSWNPERTADDTYTFERVDTIRFQPTEDYESRTMHLKQVGDYVKGSGYQCPVYMVTGIKIAQKPAVSIKSTKKQVTKAEVGITDPSGIPLEVGTKLNTTKDATDELEFTESTDFVFGIRWRKLFYKKALFSRKVGKLQSEQHNKGATLVDSDIVRPDRNEGMYVEEQEIEEDPEAIEMDQQTDRQEDEVRWIIPRQMLSAQ